MAKTKTTKSPKTKTSKTSKSTAKPKTTTKTRTTKNGSAKTAAKTSPKSPSSTNARSKAKSPQAEKLNEEVTVDRRGPASERRTDAERREEAIDVSNERREGSERREKVSRRRQIDPTTCERDYDNEEIEFMHALDAYKRSAGRMFPTCSEILEVVRDLGYRRLTPEEIGKLKPLNTVDAESDATSEGSENPTPQNAQRPNVPRREEYATNEFDDTLDDEFEI